LGIAWLSTECGFGGFLFVIAQRFFHCFLQSCKVNADTLLSLGPTRLYKVAITPNSARVIGIRAPILFGIGSLGRSVQGIPYG
jgi:hypothetical protein